MIKCPSVDGSVSQWKREASDDVRKYLWSHEDARLRPMQRDEHNRICDVYKDQYKLAYLSHYTHYVHIIYCWLKHFGADEVNVSRGVRIIVHSRFDQSCHNAKATADMSDVLCQSTTASIPAASFRLYHVVCSDYAGQQYVPIFSSHHLNVHQQRQALVVPTYVQVMR